jgi:hypothetical protein
MFNAIYSLPNVVLATVGDSSIDSARDAQARVP